MLRILPLLLATACGNADGVVTVTPTLTCQDYVKCHAIIWRVGLRDGPQVAGSHVVCHCHED